VRCCPLVIETKNYATGGEKYESAIPEQLKFKKFLSDRKSTKVNSNF
jgi:hypothetical protein